jgi:hypothetical protein
VTLAKLLEETKEGGEMLREARDRARPTCIAAVRKLEAALVEALGGDKLKGLPLLDDPTLRNARGSRFYGARARGKKIEGCLDDKPTLVVTQDGALRLAWIEHGETNSPAVNDAELLLEDVEDVARAVEEVLLRHVAQLSKAAARYDAFVELARKLESALDA